MAVFNAVDLEGKNVVLLWHAGVNPEDVRVSVETLQQNIGASGHLAVEHVERLKSCMYEGGFEIGSFFLLSELPLSLID
jgi:hypothetical protein